MKSRHLYIIPAISLWSLLLYSQDTSLLEKSMIACHNCYEPRHAADIESVFQFTTTIELDIWDTRRWFGVGGWRALKNNWYVRHNPFASGNINCCGGSFADCLRRIKAWTVDHPQHAPMIIFIDKKENWSEANESRKPADLDNLITSIFSATDIFTPANLRKGYSSVKEAVMMDGWPDYRSLNGKIIFVLTDGTELTARSPLDEYLTSLQQNAVCFVAPEVKNHQEVLQPPKIGRRNCPSIVFYNIKHANSAVATYIHQLNCLSRVYGALETKDSFESLKSINVNFVAVFNYRILMENR